MFRTCTPARTCVGVMVVMSSSLMHFRMVVLPALSSPSTRMRACGRGACKRACRRGARCIRLHTDCWLPACTHTPAACTHLPLLLLQAANEREQALRRAEVRTTRVSGWVGAVGGSLCTLQHVQAWVLVSTSEAHAVSRGAAWSMGRVCTHSPCPPGGCCCCCCLSCLMLRALAETPWPGLGKRGGKERGEPGKRVPAEAGPRLGGHTHTVQTPPRLHSVPAVFGRQLVAIVSAPASMQLPLAVTRGMP